MAVPGTARVIMSPAPVRVHASDAIGDVAAALVDNWARAAPVVDANDKVVGIITDGDLVRRLAQLPGDGEPYRLADLCVLPDQQSGPWEARLADFVRQPVGTIMTTDLITVSPDTSVAEIAYLMSEHGIKQVPVLNDDGLYGLVSRADVTLFILGRHCTSRFP